MHTDYTSQGQFDGLDALTDSLNASSLHTSLQQQRLAHFDYQPFSLPPTRAPSRENISSTPESPRKSASSPPLTPASTQDRLPFRQSRSDDYRSTRQPLRHPAGDSYTMTPQTSPPRLGIGLATSGRSGGLSPTSSPASSRPVSVQSTQIRQPTFNIGPAEFNVPSPSDNWDSPTETPYGPRSGTITPISYPPSRPFTPAPEPDDPYARHKRPPQPKKLEDIEPRFKFGKSRQCNNSSSNLSAHGHQRADKRHHSHLSLASIGKNDDNSLATISKKGSMGDLKRFFKGSKKRAQSPGISSVHSNSSAALGSAPFADDHGLSKKYGKFGKVLGSGAGGSVRVMKRSTDGVTFAVKEFRSRHTYETEREYAKKVTAEFCIGSTLHHGNIVETLDIMHERGRWYEVMEYCPYDLFATVMTGKMSREEVACSFMQIVSGVTFLHTMGLAHRDLKLDNVVISEYGILKIIDFGSASVFRYPFEYGIVEAHGIVGSDPYLAPEVCNELKYDPQPADIWSLAIIFCCMTLRRFPWKAPRQSDNSFRLFSTPPDSPTTVEGSASNPAPSEVHGTGQQPPKGPNRLLRILPRESRHIIGRMLELNPAKRAVLDEIWCDEWIASIEFCQQESSTVMKAKNHSHTLESQSSENKEPSRKRSQESRKALKQ
ncbi:Pkinase-domain-containing protein [Wilcoxina mikolae CBS 423.85]|nr:Pkinase-domain-containing protein [Wilcoxina mikolae CBS 423.85]